MDPGIRSQVGKPASRDRSRVQGPQTLVRQHSIRQRCSWTNCRKGPRFWAADDRHLKMVPDVGLVQGRTPMVPRAGPRPDRHRRKSVHHPRARDGYDPLWPDFCVTGPAMPYQDSPSTAPKTGNPLSALNWRSATKSISTRWPICVIGCSRVCARCMSARPRTQRPRLRPPPCLMRRPRSRCGKGASIPTRILTMVRSASILPASFTRTT
jgi:hypothetical protein